MEGVHIDRVANGKIAERWEIKDFWGVVQSLNGTIAFPQDEAKSAESTSAKRIPSVYDSAPDDDPDRSDTRIAQW